MSLFVMWAPVGTQPRSINDSLNVATYNILSLKSHPHLLTGMYYSRESSSYLFIVNPLGQFIIGSQDKCLIVKFYLTVFKIMGFVY